MFQIKRILIKKEYKENRFVSVLDWYYKEKFMHFPAQSYTKGSGIVVRTKNYNLWRLKETQGQACIQDSTSENIPNIC